MPHSSEETIINGSTNVAMPHIPDVQVVNGIPKAVNGKVANGSTKAVVSHLSNGKVANGGAKNGKQYRFDTRQVHAGLEDRALYGQCTLPVYNTASFKFKTFRAASAAFDEGAADAYIYSRIDNPTTAGLERRIASLEGGGDAIAVASGCATVLLVLMALASAGDNVIVSSATHGGTFHQFKIVATSMGIDARFCDTNDLAKVKSLIDEKTKFIYTESISNPKFSVPDFDGLTDLTKSAQIPLVCDSTFSASGYFCQPARWGADIILHSATKWIGGHGTTLGGLIISTGVSDWQSNKTRFPQLHGQRPGREGVDDDLFAAVGNRAFAVLLKGDTLRDTGMCLSPMAAQQLFIGVESLSLRCERMSKNAEILAHWLREQPQVAWVGYLGFEDHPSHALAEKYLQNGWGTVLTFGVKGGVDAGMDMVDALKLVTLCTNVGDSKTIIGHHWSTTHRQCTREENEAMGVYEDLFRVSLGIEDIQDIIDDFDQAFSQIHAA